MARKVVAGEGCSGLYRYQEAEPGRVGVLLGFGEDEPRRAFESFAQGPEVAATALHYAVKLIELGASYRRLHVGDLEVVAEVGVDVLVVVARRKLPELSGEAAAARVVHAAHAPAVAAPVAVGVHQPVELRVVGIDRAALSHRHVVGRVEGAGAEVADGAGLAHFPVKLVCGAEGVAVVLY